MIRHPLSTRFGHPRPQLLLAGALLLSACVRPSEVDDKQRRTPATAVAKAPRNTKISIGWLPQTVSRHRALLEAAGKRHRVDPEVLAIIMLVESGGWIAARSPTGAQGLMQVMPATGQQIASDRGLQDYHLDKLGEPARNIDLGSWYLAQQIETFGAGKSAEESIRLAAAAYNGGPGRLRRSLEGHDVLSSETKRYRTWVSGMYRERHATSSATFNAWLSAGGERLIAKAEAEMRTDSQAAGKK